MANVLQRLAAAAVGVAVAAGTLAVGVPARTGLSELHPVPTYGVTVGDMLSNPDRSTVWAPDACTLPTAEQPLRVAEFEDLFAAAVTGVRRVDATRIDLVLDPRPEVAARTAELAARETGCCSFFDFALSIGAGVLVLQVRTPPAYAEVLDGVALRAESAVGQRR